MVRIRHCWWCLLTETLDHFKEILLHGRETLSLEEIQTTLSSIEFNEKFDVKVSSVGDDLLVKGRMSTSDDR